MNVNRLKGKIVEMGLSIPEVAEKLEIDRSTFYRKLNSKGETLTIGEAQRLVSILELSPHEATAIFFNQDVAHHAN